MFNWMRLLGRRSRVDSSGEQPAKGRDSGEEEYEAHEEETREAAPDGSTRLRTENL
jgi:hypothetical protein